MSGLKREDEQLMKDLQGRVKQSGIESLSEDDQLMLSLLEDRYEKFLQEGVKNLRGAPQQKSRNPIRNLLSRFSPRDRNVKPIKAEEEDTRSSDTASPGSPCAVVEDCGKHWSWVTKNLVVGAVPYVEDDHVVEPGNLITLRRQCVAEQCCISAVVSCLELDENLPPGFAGPKEWERQLNAKSFLSIPLPSDPSAPIDLTMEEMLAACRQMYSIVSPAPTFGSPSRVKGTGAIAPKKEPAKVLYVHCKAGRSRCWVVAMCYVISQLGLTFEEAEHELRAARSCFSPSPEQVEYVRRFEIFLPSVRRPLDAYEEMYSRILADLLTLPSSYRHRLADDLEKLT